MNKLEPVSDKLERVKNLSPQQLSQVVDQLADRVREVFPEPAEAATAKETFYDLSPAIRRWLVWVGHDENKKVLAWLRSLDDEKVEALDHLLADYHSAQTVGKFIKIFWVSLIAVVTFTWGAVKAAPDVLDWARKALLK